MRWLRRFGLHLAAAVGATGVFVAAAAVGAHQAAPPARPAAATQAQRPAAPSPAPTAGPGILQERSLTGVARGVGDDELVMVGTRGREWHVRPAPGALIRLNGKTVPLSAVQPDDRVLVLGVADGHGGFLAHAITARRPS
jgi:hypothetical protein